MDELGVDSVSIDVGRIVRRNVASLYSSLVTRPTGQAVRLAIENVLAEEKGPISLSIIDLSEVTVMDFSCADEVVAKLLIRFLHQDRPREAFFVFRGVRDLHRDPIEVVLERHSLAAVAETEDGGFELLGSASEEEDQVWKALEARGCVEARDVESFRRDGGAGEILEQLVQRRVVFANPLSGQFQALSDLVSRTC